MYASLRFAALLALGSSAWACSSSDSSNPGKSDGGGGASASGGKTGSGGAKSTGGKTGTGGSAAGGAAATHCGADAGSDPCRTCLARACCDRFITCLADSLCSSALATHEACFSKLGAETSACFGDFTRTLQGEAGADVGIDPLAACIITDCSQACGGPGVM